MQKNPHQELNSVFFLSLFLTLESKAFLELPVSTLLTMVPLTGHGSPWVGTRRQHTRVVVTGEEEEDDDELWMLFRVETTSS